MAVSVTGPEADAATEERLQLVVFSLAGEPYGLPIEQIQEVIRYREPRSVASRYPWVRGVVNLRGEILAVTDLAARLGLAARVSDERRIIIVRSSEGAAGLIVDSVDEVAMVAGERLEPAPTADTELVRGIAKLEDRLVVVLDAPALLGAAV
jgi:purine-binding chemotaxis protein CheW